MENTENNNSTPKAGRHSERKGHGKLAIGLLVAVMALGGTAAYVGNAIASGNFHGARFGGHHGGPVQMLRQFDTNKDGIVSLEEVQTEADRRIGENDSDGDKALSLEEYEAVWLEFVRPRMVDSFQNFDEDGDGRVTKSEVDEKIEMMISRLDRNEDGKITKEEMRPPMRHGPNHGDKGWYKKELQD